MTAIGQGRDPREAPPAPASRYGTAFDALVERWEVIVTEHDIEHPDRDMCGGVGGCSMLATEVRLETDMVEALRERLADRSPF